MTTRDKTLETLILITLRHFTVKIQTVPPLTAEKKPNESPHLPKHFGRGGEMGRDSVLFQGDGDIIMHRCIASMTRFVEGWNSHQQNFLYYTTRNLV